MLREKLKVAGKKFLSILLVLLIAAQFVSMFNVDATPIYSIGTTTQSTPFESNPTAATSSGIGTVTGALTNTYDGDWDTQCNFKYGFGDGYFELSGFDAPAATFAIGWVDFKISYKAQGSTDDRYRIVYQVGSSAWQVLQDWVSGADSKFTSREVQAQRTWTNQPEPNDGGWDWTDIAQTKFRVETNLVNTNDAKTFTLYEVWLSIYSAPLPPAGLSVQPSFVNVSVSDVFFVDVYVRDIALLWGYQIRISYDPSVLSALEYYTYYPFNDASPSTINETGGYVEVAYSEYMEIGNVSLTGDSPLTRIYFQVDSVGKSALHFSKVLLVKWGGAYIYVEKADGKFDNRVGFPTAEFTWTPSKPAEDETVNFNASTSKPIGNITSYEWDFGDGQTGTGNVTTHVYPVAKDYPETYSVTLNVTSKNGLSDWITKDLTVTKHDVAVDSFQVVGASTTSPRSTTVGSTVQLSPTVSNIGHFNETFTIKFYYNDTIIDTDKITPSQTVNMTLGQKNQPLVFNWDTAGMSFGFYVIKVAAGPVTSETHISDNNKTGDGYSSSVVIQRIHDIAVLGVAVSPTEVAQGNSVTVNVTVRNQGNFTDKFNLLVSYEDMSSMRTLIVNQTDTLDPGAITTLTSLWNTTGVVPGYYRIYAEVPPLTFGSGDINETIITNNVRKSAQSVKVMGHNILVSGIGFVPALPPFMVGATVQINVVIKNTGSENETNISVTVKRNETVIGSSTLTSLEAGKSKTTTINWDTTGLSHGQYNISAVASTVAGETSIEDNTFVYGLVTLGYHDIAVTNVTASPKAVELGQQITIYVTVKNTGVFLEQNFNVTAYYNQTKIGTITVRGLSAGASNSTLSFVLTTTGMARGFYDIKVVATTVPNEVSTSDNTRIFHFVAVGYHDIAVTDVIASPTDVVVGDSVSITVTVVNHGNFTETFDLTVSYDDTKIDTQTVSSLAPGQSDTVSFTWNTGGVSPDDYVIEAEASVTGEAHLADNTKSSDTVKVNAGSNMLLYAAVGAAIIIVLAVVLLYFFKLRKPKS